MWHPLPAPFILQSMAQIKKLHKTPEKAQNKPILVIIPYLGEESQGKELKLAVTGWKRFCRFPYQMVIVADKVEPIQELSSDAFLIEEPRVEEKPGCYRPHLDVMNRIRVARAAFPEQDSFIIAHDDCFAVNDFTLEDIQVLKTDSAIYANKDAENLYRRDKAITKEILESEGRSYRSFSVHLPMYYESAKYDAIVERFDLFNRSLNIEDLYHNTYNADKHAILLAHGDDPYRCWMSNGGRNPDEALEALSNKKWISCAVSAYSFIIEKLLCRHYNLIL